jgi:hypothetical protein
MSRIAASRNVWATSLAIGVACLSLKPVCRAQDQAGASKPTEQHKLLEHEVGTWDANVKIWGEPGAEPLESKATEKNELLPGGLWIISRFEGEMAGMKFSGVGTTGYDPIEKKYVATWIDSMSPHMMIMKGEYDPATKTTTLTGDSRDPMTGKMVSTKEISRHIDENSRTFEMYVPDKDGKMFKVMEIQYKRRS